MNRSRILSILIAGVILGGSGFLALRLSARAPHREEEPEKSEAAPVPVEAAIVHSGSLSEAVRASGTLQPLPNGQSRVAAQVAGRLESVRVRAGQTVRTGDVLATVSRPDLQALVRQAGASQQEMERDVEALRAERRTRAEALPLLEQKARADLSAAQAHAALIRAGSRPEEIERAQAALQAEQATLDRLKAGAPPQEIAQAEAAVRDARANRDALRKDAARKHTLFDKQVVAEKDVERADADLTTAQANLDTKEQLLSLVRAGTRPEEIRAQESRVREADAQLRQARAGARPEELREVEAAISAAQSGVDQARAARSELHSLDQKIRAAESRVEAARGGREVAGSAARRAEIRSPMDGVVRQVLVNVGDGIAEQSPVVEIVNRNAFRAVLDLPAGSGGLVRPGVRAEITAPGVPGVTFPGVVRTLLPAVNAETGLIPVEVWITDRAHRLTEGMAVDARFFVRRDDRRLFVPSRAIFAREGERFVYVIQAPKAEPSAKATKGDPGEGSAGSGETARAQAVDVGREQGEETEILSGLREGERIVRDGSLSLADGTPVASGSNAK
jgi:RND family efflux transporter MFP subunit